ncbi:MAG: lytic murein transglycosylase [Syntrophobacteraceae bacterium]
MRHNGKTGSDTTWAALVGWIGVLWGVLGLAASGLTAEDPFPSVKKKLLQEGYGAVQVEDLFSYDVTPVYKLVAGTFRIQESKLNYDRFLEPGSIALARRFLQEHQSSLARAEKTYGVDPPVIAAILLVESGFGNGTGKTHVLSVFATFALMDQVSCRNKIWAMLSPKDKKRWERDAFDEKLQRRSEWAYGELRALLKLMQKDGLDPRTLRGSYMGAIGWPQFLPSSIVKYGADGNQDGRIDLYTSDDAIFSIANYLRGFGWSNAKTRADREEVIYHYNKSRPYVRTILDVAARLGGS